MNDGDLNLAPIPAEGTGPPPPLMPASLPDFHQLDPRSIKLWRLTYAITAAVTLLIALMVGLGLVAAFPSGWPWILTGWLAIAGPFGWLVIGYPPRAFRAWGYRIDGKVLETRRGIWFRVIQLLPLSRLQHVDLHRGPLERSFGLATLILHTAGTHYAILTIPGLAAEEAMRLRDRLVAAGGGDDAV